MLFKHNQHFRLEPPSAAHDGNGVHVNGYLNGEAWCRSRGVVKWMPGEPEDSTYRGASFLVGKISPMN
jgi:hypothetical protein